MTFEDFESLIDPPHKAAARTLLQTLAEQHSQLPPDDVVARLRDAGLLSDAAFQQYHADATLEITQPGQPQPDPVWADTVVRGTADTVVLAAPIAPQTSEPAPEQEAAEHTAASTARLSNYQLLGRLNAGGMGEIQLARDTSLLRKVAYKQLLDSTLDVPGLSQRFLLEAQVMAQLDHPNVVPVYALESRGDDRYAYAMKLVRGHTLAELLDSARTSLRQHTTRPAAVSRDTLLEHFLKVCDAMAYAHAKGVIHRDLKPANIMVGSFNEVYVMDWGLARLIAGPTDDSPDNLLNDPAAVDRSTLTATSGQTASNTGHSHTRLGEVLGTPRYMAPEQAAGANASLDERSDIYALGLILYELLSLRKARPQGYLETLLENARQGILPPLQAPAPGLSIAAELHAIVATATAVMPAQRYPTVAALADDIRHFLRGEPVSVLADSLLRKTQRWIGRHRQATLLMLMGIVMIALGATSLSLYQRYVVLEQAQFQKALLSRFVTGFADQKDRIEKQFLLFSTLLEDLVATAAATRLYGLPATEPIFTLEDYRTLDSGPPDLYPASRYADNVISIDYPVAFISHDAQPNAIALLRQLTPLRHQFRRIALMSEDASIGYLDPPAARQLIAEQGVPLHWSYIGLEEGVLLLYPGTAISGLPQDYDPRQALWYQQALADQDGRFCGSFRSDSLGEGLLLSCHSVIRDEARHPLGVAGVDIPLDYLIDTLLRWPEPNIIETFLLDSDGHIMIRSSDYQQHDQQTRSLEGPLYTEQEVLANLRQGRFGHLETERDDQPLWIVYDDIASLGWSYVVEFNPAD
ncbi:MAG: serine/threonine protein kinase [Gammaproteobacteria bacterium]